MKPISVRTSEPRNPVAALVRQLLAATWCYTAIAFAPAALAQTVPTADRRANTPFEGELYYCSYEHHSAILRKFSQGRAYNGVRTLRIVLNRQAAHIVEEEMHLHTIIDYEKNRVWLYSDVTNSGLEADTTFLSTYLSSYDPAVSKEQLPKTSTLATTGKTVTYQGEDFPVYKGQIRTGEYTETDVEMWYLNQAPANRAYRYLLSGLPVPGIVRRGVLATSGQIPLLGQAKSMIAIELMEQHPRPVEAEELRLPAGIRTERFSQPNQLTKFYKANTQELKNRRLYPETMQAKEVDYALREQWDFADAWLKKRVELGEGALTWAKVAEETAELTGELAEKLRGAEANTHKETAGMELNEEENHESLDRKRKTIYINYKKKYLSCADAIKKTIEAYKRSHEKLLRSNASKSLQLDDYETHRKAVKQYQQTMREIRHKCFDETGRDIPLSFEQTRSFPQFYN